jgi:prepilin-type N-terminal cleavage/methylation domain-containing protein
MGNIDDSRTAHNKGFTLIEILLAMLITSILVLGVNSAYHQAYLIWSSAENRRPFYQTARIITETFRQELSCLYIPPLTEEDDFAFELLYLPNDKTELTFYTLTPSWKGSLESSRPAKVRYRFAKDPHSGEALLERFEQPCAGEKIIGNESSDIVAEGLSEFRVWIADSNSGPSKDLWKDSYNSNDTPPKALKILFKCPAKNKQPEIDFQCCILIPSQGPLTP